MILLGSTTVNAKFTNARNNKPTPTPTPTPSPTPSPTPTPTPTPTPSPTPTPTPTPVPTSGLNKVIEMGWDTPTSSYVKNNIATMEQKPFDGIVIKMLYKNSDFSSWPFGSYWMDINDSYLQTDIANLKATNFVKFTDNFVVVITSPNAPFIDWFDDWSRYIANIQVAAQAAKNAGLKGIILDTENYNSSARTIMWQYDQQKYASTKTLDDYKAQANLRGQQIMDAINSVYPDIKIMVTFGTGSVAYWQSKSWGWKPYELVVPFLDGMLSHMNAPARLVDGFEPSYPFKTASDFTDGYSAITVKGENLSSVTNQYASFVSAGFGLWFNYKAYENNWSTTHDWDTTNFGCNYFTPDTFRQTVCLALTYSESYLWVWSGTSPYPNWWTGSNLPQAYVDALAQGKANYASGTGCQ